MAKMAKMANFGHLTKGIVRQNDSKWPPLWVNVKAKKKKKHEKGLGSWLNLS